MSRRFIRHLLVLMVMLSSEVWALGLGDVRLDSALNEPLRAEIELLGATPEELANLNVGLASSETFTRYGLDRPFFLQDMTFEIVRSGQADGNYIRVRSGSPMTEPFLTFLVEATWARGRLLREYTVLLDPPTFAPPTSTQQQPAVTAPQRSTSTDSGRIDRTPVPQPTQQATQPRQSSSSGATPPQTSPAPQQHAPKPQPVADNTPYDTSSGGDYVVQRGETLWGIASSMRPDSRLSMNQTMLAIFEANPQAFQGNINMLSAGAGLRMPSADEIYGIDRGDAVGEVRRQHAAWGGYVPPPQTSSEPYVDPVDSDSQTTLTLVPPDDDPIGVGTGEDTGVGEEPLTREQEVLDRIAELEAADVPIQQSLIEIRNNEMAALQAELAEIRGEVYDPPIDDPFADDPLADQLADDQLADDPLADDQLADDPLADDPLADDPLADDLLADDATDPVIDPVSQGPSSILGDDAGGPSLVDQAIGFLKSFWTFIAGVLVVVAGLLFWFMRRGRDEDEDSGAWDVLDSDETRIDPLSATETLQAPRVDESIVVVEQESAMSPLDDTVEAPVAPAEEAGEETGDETQQFGSLEDTFSSETAVNLDQSDPIAEADFHMAYGLYDQAADLINGALQIEPERADLLTKLCEIYFVWGNRDAFIDAAQRLNGVAESADGDWDKIVIMGQQIAADHELFAGAGVAGATKAVDLSLGDDEQGTGALDMDFGSDEGGDDVIDLGASGGDDEAVDFLFDADQTGTDDAGGETDFSVTSEMPTIDASADDSTAEMPTAEMPAADLTAENPTIEEQFAGFDATSELPSIDESSLQAAPADGEQASDATAEVDLADLDLGVDSLAETELASLDDLDVTGTNEALSEVTGKNPQVDPDSTGLQETLVPDAPDVLIIEDETSATGAMRLAADETGQNPMMNPADSQTGIEMDESLLDATGHTQILSEDLAVETATEEAGTLSENDATMLAPSMGDDDDMSALSDDQETMLASLDDDGETDFDFAKTEALPPEVFTGNTTLDETGELPAVASTDVDLDLDDLTAALKVSELGDTVEQPRDDETVEQPRPDVSSDDDVSGTMTLAAGDMSDDLQEARTMTEVGTKLDLARAYVDMGDPAGARSILEEVLDEGDESQRQQAQSLLDSLPS
jgi:pilus assembly protein FimV